MEGHRFRVVVAEPSQRVGEAVRLDARFELVACVEDAAASVARALELRPDVLVLDSALPPGALAAAREVGARLPATRLLILHEAGEDDVLGALFVGASAYMARTTETQELLGTIARVACGETVLSPAQIDRLVEVVRDPSRPRRAVASVPSLTAREWQILERMRDGRTMPEIAGELYLSPVTVRSHARSIRRKLAADEQLRDPIYR